MIRAKKPQSGPKQRRDLQGYLDETGLLHAPTDKFFGLGLLVSPQISILHKKLIAFRNRTTYYKEFKFTNVGTHNILYYTDFIDEFFATPYSKFSCVIYDKSKMDLKKYFNNDHVKAYNSYCGSLVGDMILSLGDRFTDYLTLLADDVSTGKPDHFERDIRSKVRLKTRRNALTSIIRLESHAVTEIQLCDVLLGTVAYAFKINAGIVKPDQAKLQLVKHLQKKIRVPAINGSFDVRAKNGISFKVKEIKFQ